MKLSIRSSIPRLFVFLTITAMSFHTMSLLYNTVWSRPLLPMRRLGADDLKTYTLADRLTNTYWFTNNASGEVFRFKLRLTTGEQTEYVRKYKGSASTNVFIPKRRKWSTSDMYTNEWTRLDLLSKDFGMTWLNNTKSQCWQDVHGVIRCLPYMYLIGAPKSGTTDLYKRLVEHPDFIDPAHKEPHWITRIRLGNDLNGTIESRTISTRTSTFAYYLSTFAKLSNTISEERNLTRAYRAKSRYNEKITGDCSASTLWDNDIWAELPRNDNPLEPVYTNPHYVYKINPKASIIVLLRDPVSRLYSDYLYFLREINRKSQAMFHRQVLQGIRLFTSCLKQVSLRSCVYNPELNRQIPVRLRIGIYYIYLLEWYEVFPEDQIYVIKTEDYANDTSKIVQNVYTFLEMRPVSKQLIGASSGSLKKKNRRRQTDESIGDMWPETRDILKSFYSTFNKLLDDLMKDKATF